MDPKIRYPLFSETPISYRKERSPKEARKRLVSTDATDETGGSTASSGHVPAQLSMAFEITGAHNQQRLLCDNASSEEHVQTISNRYGTPEPRS